MQCLFQMTNHKQTKRYSITKCVGDKYTFPFLSQVTTCLIRELRGHISHILLLSVTSLKMYGLARVMCANCTDGNVSHQPLVALRCFYLRSENV